MQRRFFLHLLPYIFLLLGMAGVAFFSFRAKKRILFIFSFLGIIPLLYAGAIEPFCIRVRSHTVSAPFTAKIALISDLHLGLYKGEKYLQRVVDIVHKQNVDYILIAGDLTYRPASGDFSALFAPLSQLQKPVFAVLGNHDVGRPGPKIRTELIAALEKRNVKVLNNDVVSLSGFMLIGLGCLRTSEANTALLSSLPRDTPRVVLTHHPDTVLQYTTGVDLTFAGHTHGGQVRIPFLHRFLAPVIIPAEGGFDAGFYTTSFTRVFVTPGIGEVGLPIRFFNPPTIEIFFVSPDVSPS